MAAPLEFSSSSPSDKAPRKMRRRIPVKTCVASVALLIAGVVLLILALDFYVANPDHDGALPVLVLAVISFVPGAYSTVNLYGALRGYVIWCQW
jgi:hypothetical protein